MARRPNPPVRRPTANRPVQPPTISMQQWQGPLPPPAALEQFNRIIPDGADRIMTMVEREQEHRIQHEQTKLSASTRDFRWGQILRFILSMTCVGGSIYTASHGAHPAVSIALVSLPIMAAIRAFLTRKP